MKRAWILRHAKSSWDDPSLADHERPLAPRGRKAAKRMGRWLAVRDVHPDLVLCSTAVRARATLDLVGIGLRVPTVEIEEALYHASAATLLERLAMLPPAIESVLLIGHNPGLHALVCLLAPPGPGGFPTGALADLRLAIDTWQALDRGCARLESLVLPRALPAAER
jgi:phosphohistidine phosphatase